MDEASKVLEKLTTSHPWLPAGYQKLSLNPPLVDEVIDQNLNPINIALSDHESHECIPNQPLVEKFFYLIPPSVESAFPIESEYDTTQVFFVSSDSNELGGNTRIPSR